MGVKTLLTSATVVSAVWWGIWLARAGIDAAPTPPASLADIRQQEILRAAIDREGDEELGRLYRSLNVAHFDSRLPQTPVMWEPRLDEVGALANRMYTLQGVFGLVGTRTVILLHPKLAADERALRRTLAHEMVHASLFAGGDASTDHGSAFQSVLERLAAEGAFAGLAASREEIDGLRAWLDAEAARLTDERGALGRASEALERERLAVEAATERLGASGAGPAHGYAEPVELTTQRATYNDRAMRANDRADRYRASVDAFNREVERYNLMVAYPDGLDDRGIKKKITAG